MKYMHATGPHDCFSLACEEGEVSDWILAPDLDPACSGVVLVLVVGVVS